MTIRQSKTIKDLPNNNYSISRSMRLNGYPLSTSKNGTEIKRIRKLAMTLGFFDKEQIEKDITVNRKEARLAQEYSVVKEIDFHRMKVAGMITDKVDVNKQPDTIVIVDKSYRSTNTDTPKSSEVALQSTIDKGDGVDAKDK